MASIPTFALRLTKEGSFDCPEEVVNTPKAAAEIFIHLISDRDREHLVVILLSATNKPKGIHIATVGTLNASMVHPREIFKAALAAKASSIIIGHNHPSGFPEPSIEDKNVTRRLARTGDILGIKLQDHIIVTPRRNYISFCDLGLLEPMEVGESVKEEGMSYTLKDRVANAQAAAARRETQNTPNPERKEER